MPTITDYLQIASGTGVVAQVGVWVKLVNNQTGLSYVSTALTDGAGTYTVSPPVGQYTVWTNAVSNNPSDGNWKATGDTKYSVGNGILDVQTIAYAASITPDVALGAYIIVGNLTGPITVNAPTHGTPGQRICLKFTEDNIGNRAVAFGAGITVSNWVVNTAANAVTEAWLTTSDGTNWVLALNPPNSLASSVAVPAGGTTLTGGAIGGTVLDYGGWIRNVKSPSATSVALVDGATDDSAAINADIVTGALIAIPAGTASVAARLGNVAVNSYQLSGVGRDLTTVKLANATNLRLFEKQAGNATQITISDMTWDGNKANQTSGSDGVTFSTFSKSVIRNCRVINTYGRGVYLFNATDFLVQNVEVEGSGKTATTDGSGAAILVSGARIRVIGNRIDSPNDSGIIHGVSGQAADMVTVVGNTVHNPSYIGIAGGGIWPTVHNTRLTITANAVDGSVNSHGIDLGSSFDIIVCANVLNSNFGGFSSDSGARQGWVGNVVRGSTGTAASSGFGSQAVGHTTLPTDYLLSHTYLKVANQFYQNQQWGINFDDMRGEAIIANNLSYNNGAFAGSASHAGIVLAATHAAPGNFLVIGNMCYDDQVPKTQTYGLEIRSTVYGVSAVHNDFRGNLTAAILDSGTATYTHGNAGYNPRGFLTAPAPAASGVILYNPFNCDCMVYINGSSAAALTAVAIGGIAAPVNGTHVAMTTGGTLTTASYFYRVSALNPNGETLASTETSIAVTGPTGAVLVKWTAVPGATGYNVYGRTTGAELKMASNIQANAFLDDGSVTPVGALPGADTTGNTALTGWAAAPANDSVIGIYLPWGNGIKVTYTTFVTANWQWFGL